jgi:hypothetical protein
MIKVVQPAQEAKPAVIEISGPNFFVKLGEAVLITKDLIILMSANKLEIVPPGPIYDIHLHYCIKNGKEVNQHDWFSACKEFGSGYTKQINHLVEIEIANEIFCL